MNLVEPSNISFEKQLHTSSDTYVKGADQSENSCVDLDPLANDEHETLEGVGRVQGTPDEDSTPAREHHETPEEDSAETEPVLSPDIGQESDEPEKKAKSSSFISSIDFHLSNALSLSL